MHHYSPKFYQLLSIIYDYIKGTWLVIILSHIWYYQSYNTINIIWLHKGNMVSDKKSSIILSKLVHLALNALQESKIIWTILNNRGMFNSLAHRKLEWNFRYVIFQGILVIDGWGISCETALIWMSVDFTDDQSTLVQVMAWCRQAASHYLNRCWPRSLIPYGITRPQWAKY